MDPSPERIKPVVKDGVVFYEVTDEHGKTEIERSKDIFHVPGFGFDGLMGYNPVTLMREAIGGDLAAQRYMNELYANDGAPRGHYETATELSEPAYKRMKRSFEGMADHGNRHQSPILEEGMKWATAHLKPEDVQMIESRMFGIQEIARFFRISPHLLQDLTNGTFSNITELGRQFIVFTMMPWLKRWQAEIDRKILGPGYFSEFNVNAFMQGDPKARSEYYKGMLSTGAMRINEVRKLENLEDVGPDGDVLFVPLNMVPLDIAVKGPQPKPIAGPQPDDSTDTEDDAKDGDKADDELSAVQVEKNLHRNTVEAVLADGISRMLTKECNAAKRASKNPSEFFYWMEEFYGKHKAMCHEVFSCASAFVDVYQLVDEHVKWSMDDLVKASECSASELQDSVAACVDKWHEQRQHVPIGDE
jgi:HK97 family phage portal protein